MAAQVRVISHGKQDVVAVHEQVTFALLRGFVDIFFFGFRRVVDRALLRVRGLLFIAVGPAENAFEFFIEGGAAGVSLRGRYVVFIVSTVAGSRNIAREGIIKFIR